MKKKKTSLGRGLGALIPASGGGGAEKCPLSRIKIANEQPRTQFDQDGIDELANSIGVHGILQPLVVRPSGEDYLPLPAERRYWVAIQSGLKSVPVVVRDVGEPGAFELSLVENIQRKNLNPVEEARAYAHLIDDLGYRHEDLGRRLGKGRSTISNYLRILELPEDVLMLLSSGELSMGHGRALLGLPDRERMAELAERAVQESLSVRELERLVNAQKLGTGDKVPRKIENLRPYYGQIEKEAGTYLGLPVKVSGNRRGAQMRIGFKTLGELESLMLTLKKATDSDDK